MLLKDRIVFLDLIRATAAFGVFFSHLRAMVLPDFQDIPNPSIALKFWYFFTGLGHQWVIVFFVLSGFFVGGSVIAAKDSFDFKKYLVSRLTRLWVVLIPVLFITAAIDFCLGHFAPQILASAFYDQWHSGPNPARGYSSCWTTFLGNLLFLQTILCNEFGTNSPLWSLAFEFWYYFAFPLITISIGYSCDPNRLAQRFFSIACLALLWFFLPKGLIEGFVPWLLGVFAFILSRHFVLPSGLLWLRLTSLAGLFWIFYLKKAGALERVPFPQDWIVGFSFFFVCWFFAVKPYLEFRHFIRRTVIFLSESSYTLYALHFPLIMLTASFFIYFQVPFKNLGNGWTYLLSSSSILIAVAGTYWLFERNTYRFRNAILNLLKL